MAALDAAGNISAASAAAPMVVADVTAPTVPTLTATATSSTQVDLSWTAATDDVGVTGYTVYRNGTKLTTVTGTATPTPGSPPVTTLSYTVTASDAAGNTSAPSTTVTVTTPAGAGGTVVFDDEFNGTSVDPRAVVGSRNRAGDAVERREAVLQAGDVPRPAAVLEILSKVDSSCSGYAYTSGMVQWNTFILHLRARSRYRAKQPAGTGTWPAQWLLGANCQAAFKHHHGEHGRLQLAAAPAPTRSTSASSRAAAPSTGRT